MMNIDEKLIAEIVKEVLSDMSGKALAAPASAVKVTADDYPLYTKRPELIKTSTGKSLDEITLAAVADGKVGNQDVRIAPATLEMQAQIAESIDRPQLAENFRRAQELIAVPDKRILEMYNALRPYRSTKAELFAMADELENQYQAKICAAMVREAAEVYDQRGRLKAE